MNTETKEAIAALPLQFNVKGRRAAEYIAKALKRGNPDAAAKYMAKYELRRSIEQAAVDGEMGVRY